MLWGLSKHDSNSAPMPALEGNSGGAKRLAPRSEIAPPVHSRVTGRWTEGASGGGSDEWGPPSSHRGCGASQGRTKTKEVKKEEMDSVGVDVLDW